MKSSFHGLLLPFRKMKGNSQVLLLLLLLDVLPFFPPLQCLVSATNNGLLAEVWLEASSGSYVAKFNIGTPPQSKLLLLDIAQNSMLLQCRRSGISDVPRGPLVTGDSATFRSIAGKTGAAKKGMQLALDTFTFNTTDGVNPGLSDVKVEGMEFFCSPRRLTNAGVVGLGPGRLSPLLQLAARRHLPRHFAYCLSGVDQAPTPLFLLASNYTFMPMFQIGASLLHTPLLKRTKTMPGYRVGLKSISIGSRVLSINPKDLRGGLEISTTEPYTKLVSAAYTTLVREFRRLHNGIPRVKPPAGTPFDTCFNASGLGVTRVGPPVNQIDFVLGDGTVWIFFGWNSMVFLSEDVMCLGFLNAGTPPARSILGTFQQRDSLVEVDLEANRLGFYPTLSFIHTSCANFNFTRSSF